MLASEVRCNVEFSLHLPSPRAPPGKWAMGGVWYWVRINGRGELVYMLGGVNPVLQMSTAAVPRLPLPLPPDRWLLLAGM